MKVGDLVKLKEYCANSGRMALVTTAFPPNAVEIIFSDSGKKILAIKSNLEVVSESR